MAVGGCRLLLGFTTREVGIGQGLSFRGNLANRKARLQLLIDKKQHQCGAELHWRAFGVERSWGKGDGMRRVVDVLGGSRLRYTECACYFEVAGNVCLGVVKMGASWTDRSPESIGCLHPPSILRKLFHEFDLAP